MFEIVDDDVRTDAGACVYYKLTHEPLAQVSQKNIFFFFELFPFEYFAISLCFSLVVKCRTSNLRVLGSNPDRGTQFFPSFFQFPLIFNNPRGLWAPVFIVFTVINCKIPLYSFNNTFNSWFTFIEHPTYPHPDLTPDWIHNHPDPDFLQFYNIFNSSFTSTRPATLSLPRLFNFTIASILGSHSPDPPPPPTFFNFTIN